MKKCWLDQYDDDSIFIILIFFFISTNIIQYVNIEGCREFHALSEYILTF